MSIKHSTLINFVMVIEKLAIIGQNSFSFQHEIHEFLYWMKRRWHLQMQNIHSFKLLSVPFHLIAVQINYLPEQNKIRTVVHPMCIGIIMIYLFDSSLSCVAPMPLKRSCCEQTLIGGKNKKSISDFNCLLPSLFILLLPLP